MTISANGITQYSPEETTFTSLEMWEREYKFYLNLTKIRTFKIYRKWKSFYYWKKIVKYKKIMKSIKNLEQDLFVFDNSLFDAFLKIKKMSCILESMSFTSTKENQAVPFYRFVDSNVRNLIMASISKLIGIIVFSLLKLTRLKKSSKTLDQQL